MIGEVCAFLATRKVMFHSKFAKSRTFPARQVQRAKIILLAADGLDNMQISNQVGLGQDSVSKWRSRFLKKLPLLQEVAEKDPSGLEKAVSAFLNDSPRPGQPMHYTDEQIIRILETACRNPEELGYEASHWSLNLLVDAVIKAGIADTISAKTVSRFLKYGGDPPPSRPLLASFLRENRFSGDFCGKSE